MMIIDEHKLAQIKVAGWQPLSLIDYPGKMAAVIFLAGCNMRCHYCHNRQIWDVQQNQLSFENIWEELRRRAEWLDAMVVTGGEPTISPSLVPLLQALRQLGLLIKLDTNGTRPDVVKQIVEQGLVDYVALDIKAPPTKYVAITGMSIKSVLKTARYLKTQTRVSYMFRTTVSPFLNEQDLQIIGKNIVHGATCWQIKQCRIENAYSSVKIEKMVKNLKEYALDVVVKGI